MFSSSSIFFAYALFILAVTLYVTPPLSSLSDVYSFPSVSVYTCVRKSLWAISASVPGSATHTLFALSHTADTFALFIFHFSVAVVPSALSSAAAFPIPPISYFAGAADVFYFTLPSISFFILNFTVYSPASFPVSVPLTSKYVAICVEVRFNLSFMSNSSPLYVKSSA